jgi:hypothetical protein
MLFIGLPAAFQVRSTLARVGLHADSTHRTARQINHKITIWFPEKLHALRDKADRTSMRPSS